MFNPISTQANKLVALSRKLKKNSKTKIVTVTSGKGGVGKSTMTSNMAYILAKKGLNIAVLDADIGLSNLQVLLDVKPEKSFFDYFNGESKINDILTPTKYNNITLIAGKSGHEYIGMNNSMVFSSIVNDIVSMNRFDLLLIDTGAGINEYVQEFLELSDNIVAITTTDPSALTDVYAFFKMLSRKKDSMMLCFNHTKKYETGEAITKSLVNLAIKNKLNRKFMVEYIGNICESRSISTTGRLRKLFAKEFNEDLAVTQLGLVVDNLLKKLR